MIGRKIILSEKGHRKILFRGAWALLANLWEGTRGSVRSAFPHIRFCVFFYQKKYQKYHQPNPYRGLGGWEEPKAKAPPQLHLPPQN